MPPLADDEYQALRDSIADQGVLVPVEYDTDGNVLDGHHRLRACADLGITDWPSIIRLIDGDDDRRRHARIVNLARRHLNREQKRQLIADEIGSDPDRSDRAIGRLLGVDHKTVGSVRRELSGEIPHPAPEPVTRDEAERIHQSLLYNLALFDVEVMAALITRQQTTVAAEVTRILTDGFARHIDGLADRAAVDAVWRHIVQARIEGVYAWPGDGHYRRVTLDYLTWPEHAETDDYDPDIAERARQALAAMGAAPDGG